MKTIEGLDHFSFEGHPSIEMEDLVRVQDLKVICEGEFTSVDKEKFFVYTIAGLLDGNPIELLDHVNKTIIGCTVADDVIIIHAKDRKEADWMAANGLEDTIKGIEDLINANALEPSENSGIITETQVRPQAS